MGESEPFVLSGDHQTHRVWDYSFRLIAENVLGFMTARRVCLELMFHRDF